MKSITTLCALILIGVSAISQQLNISTEGVEFYDWNEAGTEWVYASENLEEVSLFAFNEDMTLIKHTTASIQSSFYISDSWQNEDGENIFYFFVTSDVGNKYLMIVDYVNKNVRFVNNERSRMSKWITKKAWINE